MCFGTILGISYAQKAIKDSNDKSTSKISSAAIQGIGFLSSVVITVVNAILMMVSRRLSK